jgi:peptide chain release factor subunit 3
MGCYVIGKLNAGLCKKGDKVMVMPLGREVIVQEILVDDEPADVAQSGDNVKLKLKNIEEEEIHPGFVVCMLGSPCTVGNIFDARVQITELSGESKIIAAGFTCILHIHTAIEEVAVKRLICYVDKKTGKPDKERGKPRFIKQNEIAIIRIETSEAVCMEVFKEMPMMARFTLRDQGKTIGRGNVLKIIRNKPVTAAEMAGMAAVESAQ